LPLLLLARLRPNMALVELQQRVTDVFSADTSNVEDYLRQIQDMTIITAIQVGGGGATSRRTTASSISDHSTTCVLL
jgi:hypothetical protein